MINKTNINKVLEKINTDKVNLSLLKVKLSIMDDIDEALGRGFGMEEFIEEQLDIAQEAMTKARDIRRFEMDAAYTDAEQLIEEAEQALKELGIENNAEIKDYRKQLEELDKLSDDMKQRQDRIG
tara:strand:- start:373 stop:747 length:375 start_codon:yes stop_codon:yes gene_type:complete